MPRRVEVLLEFDLLKLRLELYTKISESFGQLLTFFEKAFLRNF